MNKFSEEEVRIRVEFKMNELLTSLEDKNLHGYRCYMKNVMGNFLILQESNEIKSKEYILSKLFSYTEWKEKFKNNSLENSGFSFFITEMCI